MPGQLSDLVSFLKHVKPEVLLSTGIGQVREFGDATSSVQLPRLQLAATGATPNAPETLAIPSDVWKIATDTLGFV